MRHWVIDHGKCNACGACIAFFNLIGEDATGKAIIEKKIHISDD